MLRDAKKMIACAELKHKLGDYIFLQKVEFYSEFEIISTVLQNLFHTIL